MILTAIIMVAILATVLQTDASRYVGPPRGPDFFGGAAGQIAAAAPPPGAGGPPANDSPDGDPRMHGQAMYEYPDPHPIRMSQKHLWQERITWFMIGGITIGVIMWKMLPTISRIATAAAGQ